MNGEHLTELGIDVLRHAKRGYLASHPLTTADHVGLYAFILHEGTPSPACCLYYLDSKKRLLEQEVLYSGIQFPVEECCEHLAQAMARHRAACAAVSMTRSYTGLNHEDLDRASRIALFCETKEIPLLDIVWVDAEGYLPLCRFFGRNP